VRTAQPPIRTLPANEDTRLLWLDPLYAPQPPPLEYRAEDFPYINDTPPGPSRASPKPGPRCYIYADVLLDKVAYPRMLEVLPREIREMIWQHHFLTQNSWSCHPSIFHDPIAVTAGHDQDPERPRFLPAICNMSRWTRDEIVAVFLRGAMLKIESAEDNDFFREFIATVPGGVNHVRRLYFSEFDGYDETIGERNLDLELAVACRGLHTLRLKFDRKVLGTDTFNAPPAGGRVYVPKTVEELVAKYGLRRLLDCDTLRKVEWDGVVAYEKPFRPTPILDALAGWLMDEFARRGRKIESVATWRILPCPYPAVW